MQAGKAQMSLHVCQKSSEPLLLTYLYGKNKDEDACQDLGL